MESSGHVQRFVADTLRESERTFRRLRCPSKAKMPGTMVVESSMECQTKDYNVPGRSGRQR